MDFKDFVEKAKGAAAATAAALTEQAKSAPAPAPLADAVANGGDPAPASADADPTPGVPATTAEATAPVVVTDQFAELKAFGAEKVKVLMSSFQQALPAIKMAGYELTEFEIELGVTPKLIPHFRRADKSPEDIERAREALRENRLGGLILGGLLKAGEVHKQIKVAGFGFTHIEIELGLIPSVRLQYKNDDLGADSGLNLEPIAPPPRLRRRRRPQPPA